MTVRSLVLGWSVALLSLSPGGCARDGGISQGRFIAEEIAGGYGDGEEEPELSVLESAAYCPAEIGTALDDTQRSFQVKSITVTGSGGTAEVHCVAEEVRNSRTRLVPAPLDPNGSVRTLARMIDVVRTETAEGERQWEWDPASATWQPLDDGTVEWTVRWAAPGYERVVGDGHESLKVDIEFPDIHVEIDLEDGTGSSRTTSTQYGRFDTDGDGTEDGSYLWVQSNERITEDHRMVEQHSSSSEVDEANFVVTSRSGTSEERHYDVDGNLASLVIDTHGISYASFDRAEIDGVPQRYRSSTTYSHEEQSYNQSGMYWQQKAATTRNFVESVSEHPTRGRTYYHTPVPAMSEFDYSDNMRSFYRSTNYELHNSAGVPYWENGRPLTLYVTASGGYGSILINWSGVDWQPDNCPDVSTLQGVGEDLGDDPSQYPGCDQDDAGEE